MKSEKICLGLCNPKSPENVASVLRAAGNYQVNQILYTGDRYPRALERNPDIPRLSRKVSEGIPVTQIEHFNEAVVGEFKLVCVELAENAIPLPDFQHPEKALYVFGPEDGTISQGLIDHADAVVFIPTQGCMNLAATVNVVLYDRLAKMAEPYDSNVLIQQSRDTNNKVKVN